MVQTENLKVIAFDYGRTLFDRETNDFFPDVAVSLKALRKKYKLAIVSFSRVGEVAERVERLKKAGIYDLFFSIEFTDKPEKKNCAYVKLLKKSGIEPNELAIVDDYVIRGYAFHCSLIHFDASTLKGIT